MRGEEVGDDLLGLLQELDDLVDGLDDTLLLDAIASAIAKVERNLYKIEGEERYLKILTMSSKASRRGLSATRKSSTVRVPLSTRR